MVVPFDRKLINPASLDVRLGDNLMIETMYQEDLVRLDISKRTEDDPYLLMPGHFAWLRHVSCLISPTTSLLNLYSSRHAPGMALITFLLVGAIQAGMAADSRLNLKTNDDTAQSSSGLG